MFKKRTIVAVIGVLATSITLTACSTTGTAGGDNSSSAPSQSAQAFNDQDVLFAQSMIPHHTQAVEMADVILAKDDIDASVADLAQTIKDAQAPEIEVMNGWLAAWGESAGMSGMDHGTDGMMSDGMMSDDDMGSLESATGVDASRLFLQQMTVHHNGAIAMAEAEVDNGENPDATALAQKIIDDQTAEIELMQGILSTL